MRAGQIIGFVLWQGSSQTVQLHTWGFFALFLFSPNPSSPEALGSTPILSWVQHQHWHKHSQQQLLSHRMHILCVTARQPCPQSLGAGKPFRGLKRVLVPLWFSLGTWLPKPSGLHCVKREDFGVTGKMSLATVWNGTSLTENCVSSAPGQQQTWLPEPHGKHMQLN